MELEIGGRVRVLSKDGQFSRRGYIALTNEDGTCDIIYQKGTESDEESMVATDRITPLQPFETGLFSGSPLDAKTFGNKLFELKDFEAAYEYYLRSHKIMQSSGGMSVGKRVIIRIDSLRPSGEGDTTSTYILEIGDVSDVRENGAIDVIYDNPVGEDGSDEEDNISADRVFVVFKEKRENTPGMESEVANLDLQRAVLMNLSKCALKRGLKGWAVKWALLAKALIRGENDSFEQSKRDKHLADALMVLCKSMLQACRPHMAKQSASELLELEEQHSGLPRRAKTLIREIDSFSKKRQKDNRVLARNIAEWVDVAMSGKGAVEGVGDFAGGEGGQIEGGGDNGGNDDAAAPSAEEGGCGDNDQDDSGDQSSCTVC